MTREAKLTCEIRFAAEGAATHDVEILAYNGGVLEVGYGREVVDLAGLEHLAKIPFLRDHDRARIAGFSTEVDNDKSRLLLKGKLLANLDEGVAIRELAKAGFPWQASIGWQVLEDEFVPAGQSRVVNGQSIPGPFWHDKKCRLKECSIVPLGADENTTVKAAAAAGAKKMADPTTTPDPVAAERARVKALRAAFPDDRSFADEHEEKGSTLEQAKLAYAELAGAKLKAANERAAAAEKALEAEKKAKAPSTTHVPGVRPAGDKTPPSDGGEKTARQRWDEKVREARGRPGVDREAAVKAAQRENPELHREMLAEVNPGKPEPAYRAGLK